MIKNTDWVVHVDDRVHAVRVTIPNPMTCVMGPVYVDAVLVHEKAIPLVSAGEICRFHKDGHDYVLSLKGWGNWIVGFHAQGLELRVDGLLVEPSKDGPLVVPTAGAKTDVPQVRGVQRIEIIETQRIEQPMGEDRKVIDNLNSSAPLQRKITTSKEWSQTITIEDEKGGSLKGQAGGKVWGIVDIKVEAEARIRERYATSTETKKRYTDEVTVEVRAKTKLEVIFVWKQVWQCGIIRVHTADGSTVEWPYRLCLEPTFDQRQLESSA